jgi:hypothetical protein
MIRAVDTNVRAIGERRKEMDGDWRESGAKNDENSTER